MTGATSGLAAPRDVPLPPRCVGCGTSVSWFCADCRDQSDPIIRPLTPSLLVAAAGAHEGPPREAIHRLKYGREPALAAELGALIAARLAADVARGVVIDAVVPVRLHPRRERERGYDQARAIAAATASRTGLPLHPAVHRVHGGVPQATLGREANVLRGAFIGEAGSLAELCVALIEPAKASRACGARTVYVEAIEE